MNGKMTRGRIGRVLRLLLLVIYAMVLTVMIVVIQVGTFLFTCLTGWWKKAEDRGKEDDRHENKGC